MRLRSDIFISGLLKIAQSHGGMGMVLRKGHPETGSVALVLRIDNTSCTIYAEARDTSGNLAWISRREKVNDRDVSQWVEKESSFDPDLWVIEVEGCAAEAILEHTR